MSWDESIEESTHHTADKLSAHSLILTRVDSRKVRRKVLPQRKMLSHCDMHLIEGNIWTKLLHIERWVTTHFFAAYSCFAVDLWNSQNSKVWFSGFCPLPPGKIKWNEETGKFAILRAFALRGCGKEQNMNRERRKHFRRWKQALKGNWCNITNSGINIRWMPNKNLGYMSKGVDHRNATSRNTLSSGLSVALGRFGSRLTSNERNGVNLSSVYKIWIN